MWHSKTVSIVLPAYNEEKYIRPAVEDFFVAGVVDEVIVVDKHSRDRTAGVGSGAGAGRSVEGGGAGLRARAAPAPARGDARHRHHGGSGWHLRRPRRAEAARLC